MVSATWDWENVAGRLRDIYTEISTAGRVEKGWGVEEETRTKPRILGGPKSNYCGGSFLERSNSGETP